MINELDIRVFLLNLLGLLLLTILKVILKIVTLLLLRLILPFTPGIIRLCLYILIHKTILTTFAALWF